VYRNHTHWLVVALAALGLFTVCAGLSVYWAFTGQSGDSFHLVGNTGHGVIVSSIIAVLSLGLCVGSLRSSRCLAARCTSERSAASVAHVQASLQRRD
jgi:hypothetical protein